MPENTRIYKSTRGGWSGRTQYENINGYDWEIRTHKTSRGHIVAMARAGRAGDNSFTYSVFDDPNIELKRVKGRATEANIKKIHYEALAKFDQMEEAGDLPTRTEVTKEEGVQVGQIIYMDGPYESSHRDLAIYEIRKTKFGQQYLWVDVEDLRLGMAERVKPEKEKFGIGYYYRPGKTVDKETLTNLVIDAKAKAAEEERSRQSEEVLDEASRQAKIEEGRPQVTIPKWAKAIIVAELHQDQSEVQTDYFGYSTEETVYLAFSKHKRDLFPELRKAAAKFEPTKKYATPPDVNRNGEKKNEENKSWWHPADEHREKYSMGAGYYLGESKYSGWIVQKEKYLDFSHPSTLENFAIAAAEGRWLVDNKPETKKKAAPKADPVAEAKEVLTTVPGLQLVKYSAKSVALFGDTKPIKDQLKAMGGRFNPNLKHPDTGKKTAGWIFPIGKEEQVRALMVKDGTPASRQMSEHEKEYDEVWKPRFVKMAKAAGSSDAFYNQVREIKDVPGYISEIWRAEVDPHEQLTPKQAATKFYNEVTRKDGGSEHTEVIERINEKLNPYGWEAKPQEGGQIGLHNANGKYVCYIKFRKGGYNIYDTGDNKLLSGNNHPADGALKLATKMYFAQLRTPKPEPKKSDNPATAKMKRPELINEGWDNGPHKLDYRGNPKPLDLSVKSEVPSDKALLSAGRAVVKHNQPYYVYTGAYGMRATPLNKNFNLGTDPIIVVWGDKEALYYQVAKRGNKVGTKPKPKKTAKPKTKATGKKKKYPSQKEARAAFAQEAKAIWDKKKMTEAEVIKTGKAFQEKRGQYGIIDAKQTNRKVLAPTHNNLKRWLTNPGRYDLIGVDTLTSSDPTVVARAVKRARFFNSFGL